MLTTIDARPSLRVWTRSRLLSIVGLVLASLAIVSSGCARRLPPYRGELPPPLPRATAGGVAAAPSVPPPPSSSRLDLHGVTSVGVRFEYDGREEGPNGASQAFDAAYYHGARQRFGDALRDALRGHSIALGPANGEEDLLVTIVLREMHVHPEACRTIRHSRRVCTGFGRNRTCDWESDDDEICWTPITLSADVLTTRGGESGRVTRLSEDLDAHDGLSAGLGALHETLARTVAAVLVGGGLP